MINNKCRIDGGTALKLRLMPSQAGATLKSHGPSVHDTRQQVRVEGERREKCDEGEARGGAGRSDPVKMGIGDGKVK